MEQILDASDVAAALRDVLAGTMTKAQLGEWAYQALLADEAETKPFEHRRRLEISTAIHQLMHAAEGPEYELDDAELHLLIERLERVAQNRGADYQMALVPGVHEGAAADLASAAQVAATVGAAIFSLSTVGAATKADFFDAVRARLPLDPPVVSSRSWDALLDSFRGGIEEVGAALIVITWTGAADLHSACPADYDIAIAVLRAVTSDIGNEQFTVGKPKQVCVYVA